MKGASAIAICSFACMYCGVVVVWQEALSSATFLCRSGSLRLTLRSGKGASQQPESSLGQLSACARKTSSSGEATLGSGSAGKLL